MVVETYNDSEAKRQRNEDVRRLVLLLVQRRWWIAAITTVCVIAAGALSLIVTSIYLAKTTLVPAGTGMPSTGIASALGGLGGLAELAGIQGPQDRTVIEAIALLESRQFTEDFIRDENLLPVLFGNRWNAKLNRWKPNHRIPDLWDGDQLFDQKIRFVDQDEKTGVVTLRIEWKSPTQAADWANELVRRVNVQMQQRALRESQTTLTYLNQQLAVTKVESVQLALQDLIEANLKQEAVASVRSDYVFRVVDPAAPPNPRDKLRPHKLVYVITGFFFGIVLSLLTIVAIDAMQNIRRWLKSEQSSR